MINKNKSFPILKNDFRNKEKLLLLQNFNGGILTNDTNNNNNNNEEKISRSEKRFELDQIVLKVEFALDC